MLRALLSGFLLSLVVAIGLAATVGPINHEYTSSVARVSVEGRVEAFEIHLPDDRILQTATAESAADTFPEGMVLPYTEADSAMAVEIYRLRDANEKVIGLASRLAGDASEDWMIFIAARGAMYLSARERVLDENSREVVRGELLNGSRLMEGQVGNFSIGRRLQGEQEIVRIETTSARQTL